jgi:hypothetical protein
MISRPSGLPKYLKNWKFHPFDEMHISFVSFRLSTNVLLVVAIEFLCKSFFFVSHDALRQAAAKKCLQLERYLTLDKKVK